MTTFSKEILGRTPLAVEYVEYLIAIPMQSSKRLVGIFLVRLPSAVSRSRETTHKCHVLSKFGTEWSAPKMRLHNLLIILQVQVFSR
jgi:hypothetical protein